MNTTATTQVPTDLISLQDANALIGQDIGEYFWQKEGYAGDYRPNVYASTDLGLRRLNEGGVRRRSDNQPEQLLLSRSEALKLGKWIEGEDARSAAAREADRAYEAAHGSIDEPVSFERLLARLAAEATDTSNEK